jgi:hypothetical protein
LSRGFVADFVTRYESADQKYKLADCDVADNRPLEILQGKARHVAIMDKY